MINQQNLVHWINSALLTTVLLVLVFKPLGHDFPTVYDVKNQKHPLLKEKMLPVFAIEGTVDISGGVEITGNPSVEISSLSQPLDVNVTSPVKVEPQDWEGLPVKIQR